ANTSFEGDAKSWKTANYDLQTVLKMATNGTEVWVAKGTYVGGFAVPAGVKVYGGFEAGDTRLSQRYPIVNVTILDGQDKQRVLTAGNGALIDGVIIERGRAAGKGGGGLLVEGTSPTVRNCIFRNNNITAGRGSALHVTIDSKNVSGNLLLQNTVVTGNGTATKTGHCLDFTTGHGTVQNVTVDGNHDNGLHFHQGSTVRIQNSCFSNNTGRGICHISANDKPIVENNLLWNNQVALYHFRGNDYKAIKDVNALSYAKNNITGDPKFVGSGNYSPLAVSPLIDAGQELAGLPLTDAMGNSRNLDGRLVGSWAPDIGAMEFTNARLDYTGSLTPGGKVNLALTGTPKLASILGIAVKPSAGIFFPGYGTFLLDTTGPVIYLGWAPVGTTTPITIPNGTPVGIATVVQAFGFNTKAGNMTNALDLRIR
ncbi:MAG: right-handed parallel beta-helix repeat-containing protein, partial [Planctomycetota bacterium]